MRNTRSVPASCFCWSANVTSALACATRSGLALPWPVPSSTPEPLDLKWFTITRKSWAAVPSAGRKAWASGSRALSKAGSCRMCEVPTGCGLGLLVDEGRADHVLVGDRGTVGRRGRGHELPDRRAGGRVERVDQRGQRVVATVRTGVLRGVLDLLQGQHVGAEGVDRGDDLGPLAQQVLVVRRAAGAVAVAGVDGHLGCRRGRCRSCTCRRRRRSRRRSRGRSSAR